MTNNRRIYSWILSIIAFSFILVLSSSGYVAGEQKSDLKISSSSGSAPEGKITSKEEKGKEPPEEILKRYELAFVSLSLTVGPLIAGIVILMLLIHKKGSEIFEPFFGQGQLAQLTVIVLITGNVCSLAILRIMDKSEVAAIYGGIVGYVLGSKITKEKPPHKGKPKEDRKDT